MKVFFLCCFSLLLLLFRTSASEQPRPDYQKTNEIISWEVSVLFVQFDCGAVWKCEWNNVPPFADRSKNRPLMPNLNWSVKPPHENGNPAGQAIFVSAVGTRKPSIGLHYTLAVLLQLLLPLLLLGFSRENLLGTWDAECLYVQIKPTKRIPFTFTHFIRG